MLCVALLAGSAVQASAALVNVNFTYHVDFADRSVVSANGLSTGYQLTGSARLDDAGVSCNQITIPPGSGNTFVLNFGSYTFTESSDLAGGPVLIFTATGAAFSLSAMWFDDNLTIGSGPGSRSYLLSFSGDKFQLPPDGNTIDFRTAGTAVVPMPAALPLLPGGLGSEAWQKGTQTQLTRRHLAA